MRLLEAIVDANQRRVAGDREAAISADVRDALPLAALTCIDARLNHLFPDALGIPEEQFIWLRNAGNIITGPMSSTTRSLALACAVKGAKEIAVIGHTDCLVGKTTVMQLLERMSALGVDRRRMPENLVEYFGLFGSERQNVVHGVEIVRSSPLIGSKVPVHGLLIDLATGKLEWVVNGYNVPAGSAMPGKVGEAFRRAEDALDAFARIGNAAAEELKLPATQIGNVVSVAQNLLHRSEQAAAAVIPKVETAAKAVEPPIVTSGGTPKPPADPLTTLQERMRRFTSANQPPAPPKRR